MGTSAGGGHTAQQNEKITTSSSCTTILVGKDASYDGSPLVARNEDSSAGNFDPKKVVVVTPADQPRTYTSVIGHLTIELPDNPLRYTSVPNALPDEGIWGEAGINSANIAMSATETLTSNPRVLGADPMVDYVPAHGTQGTPGYQPEVPGGIGEEDFLTLVLPYIRTPREGVLRLGALLEQYGTYEMNGVAFSNDHEIWWLETVGGHHWIAKRVPDDCYVTMPNQLGIDDFDLADALGAGVGHLASGDLDRFIAENHLDLNLDGTFNPRFAFGSHSDRDHVYNTPRAWDIQRRLNPHSGDFTGPAPRYMPDSDDIPWARAPERKLTIEDVKDVLSSHYQGTPFDPYSQVGTEAQRHLLRPIGINRHGELSILQVRPYRPESSRAVQWVAYASNPFNTLVPLYTNVDRAPDYLANTTAQVTTESFYWASRIIAALADAHFAEIIPDVERYQEKTLAWGHAALAATDRGVAATTAGDATSHKLAGEAVAGSAITAPAAVPEQLAAANDALTAQIKAATDELLTSALFIASNNMENHFSRSDD